MIPVEFYTVTKDLEQELIDDFVRVAAKKNIYLHPIDLARDADFILFSMRCEVSDELPIVKGKLVVGMQPVGFGNPRHFDLHDRRGRDCWQCPTRGTKGHRRVIDHSKYDTDFWTDQLNKFWNEIRNCPFQTYACSDSVRIGDMHFYTPDKDIGTIPDTFKLEIKDFVYECKRIS